MKRRLSAGQLDSPVGEWIVGLAFCGSGIGLLLMTLVSGFWLFAPFALVAAVFGFAFGGKSLVRAIRMTVAKTAFDVAEIVTRSPTVPIGGTAELKLYLAPKRPLTIKRAHVRLESKEVAIYRAGTRSRTYTELVWDYDEPIPMPSTVQGQFACDLRIALPALVPMTFHGRNNSLTTQCEISVEIENFPDLLLTRELVVVPEVHA